MGDRIKQLWAYIQDLLDVRGDAIMAVMSSVFILRVGLAAWPKFPPLTTAEAAFYSFAIASFAYSNKSGPKS
jgi:hypothetical protein